MRRLIALSICVAGAACTTDEAAKPNAPVALSAEGARHILPRFSPDGAHIAYWEPAPGAVGWQLWMADAHFQSPVKLPVTTVVNSIPAVWSADGKRIAAISSQYGVADVVIVPIDGGEAKRLTYNEGLEAPVSWHPDGDRIAFTGSTPGSSFTMSVISISTGKTAPLIPSEKRPIFGTWSPDGSKIIYNVFDGSKQTLWVADGDGGNAKQLTSEGFEGVNYVAIPSIIWSPDSKEVAYESRRTGTSDIWVVSVADGKTRQLTRDLRNDILPSFSPDGKWITFMSDRGQQTDVWMVSAAGGTEQRITDDLREESAPLWVPAGNAVVFGTSSVQSSVWSYSLADSSERRLTPDSIRVDFFNVSPDGKLLDYVVGRSGGISDLAVSNIDGSGWRTLLAGGGFVLNPYWSPDGSKIQFTSDRAGTQDIWVIDGAGGAPRQLTSWPGFEISGTWNSDGSAVYFVSDHETSLGDAWSVPVGGGASVRVTHHGAVGGLYAARGNKELFASVITKKDGRVGLSRLRDGGKLEPLWDESNALAAFDRAGGDSVIVDAEDGAVTNQARLVPIAGGKGRKILQPREQPMYWSRDGAFLIYSIPGATQDLGILNVATGATRRLATTPDLEAGAEFTPDGKTVVFRRVTVVQRVFRADVPKVTSR